MTSVINSIRLIFKSTDMHQSKDMLTFDPLDNNQTTAISSNNYGNDLASHLMNNNFAAQNINLVSNNAPPTNQVPSLSMPQANLMMSPQPSPTLGMYLGGMPPTFPMANQGYYYYHYQPAVGFGRQFPGPVNFPAQPVGSPQLAGLFQANQKSLI